MNNIQFFNSLHFLFNKTVVTVVMVFIFCVYFLDLNFQLDFHFTILKTCVAKGVLLATLFTNLNEDLNLVSLTLIIPSFIFQLTLTFVLKVKPSEMLATN